MAKKKKETKKKEKEIKTLEDLEVASGLEPEVKPAKPAKKDDKKLRKVTLINSIKINKTTYNPGVHEVPAGLAAMLADMDSKKSHADLKVHTQEVNVEQRLKQYAHVRG
jgi:hypothetical protein